MGLPAPFFPLPTSRARTNTVILPHPKTRIPTFSSTISPLSTPSNRHFRAPSVPKHPPTSPSVRAPVTARPLIEACQFPRVSFFGLPTAGRRTRAGLPRRFSRDPSSTPKRCAGQQAREDTSAWHRLPSLCDTSGALHKLAAQSCASVGEHNRPPTAVDAVPRNCVSRSAQAPRARTRPATRPAESESAPHH